MIRVHTWEAGDEMIGAGQNLRLSAVIAAMKTFTYSPETLPLCEERQPFAQFSDELCGEIAREALAVPERRGRLTDVTRQITGQRVADPPDHTTFEAHVGLTTVDPGLVSGLVALGFEPHDFAGPQPTGYHHNFTQQFVVDGSRAGRSRLVALLEERTDRARELVDSHPEALGFIESEVYRGDYARHLPARPPTSETLDHVPHQALTFRKVTVPTTAQEALRSGVSLDCGRAADIHLKIPGRAGPWSPGPLEQRIAQHARSRNPVELRLGEILGELGYYEQISQSGNFLYTAHFADLGDANRSFTALTEFASRYGGITEVIREACTGFWRKSVAGESGETRFCPVPTLLVRP
ncbi:hypothetical protein [Streptomyces sp. JW3]|uniref:hypothetical protein n=1 Tax=Streptomyces sp. JW3 TaxID=3456955 RepID=UPI003FA4BC24